MTKTCKDYIQYLAAMGRKVVAAKPLDSEEYVTVDEQIEFAGCMLAENLRQHPLDIFDDIYSLFDMDDQRGIELLAAFLAYGYSDDRDDFLSHMQIAARNLYGKKLQTLLDQEWADLDYEQKLDAGMTPYQAKDNGETLWRK